MIRVDIGPRVGKTLERLGAEVTAQAEEKIRLVAEQYGDPHRHAGLGLRKIARRSYEIRVGRQWRVVFLHDGERLLAYDVMNHDEVSLWLRGQRH